MSNLKNNMAVESKSNGFSESEKIFEMIKRGNEISIESLLQEGAGADVNARCRCSQGHTPILYAALRGRKYAVELLIELGADVDYCGSIGWSVLYIASGQGWVEIVQSLVKRVCDIDFKDKDGETALHNAAYFGNTNAAKCLVEAGADVNAKGNRCVTPLLYAARNCHKDVFELLLDAGANVDACDNNERSVLYYASMNGNGWTDIVKTLVRKVPNLNKGAKNNEVTSLHMAAWSGSLGIVRCLVEQGADINARNNKGATPLIYAARRGHKDVTDFLLAAGAGVDFCGDKNNTVLHIVSQFNWVDIAQSLVMRAHDPAGESVDINARNKRGKTALLLACQFGNLDIAMYLIQAKARCDIADIDGNSPLHYLIKMERPSVKLIQFFIRNIAVLLPSDYDAMLNSSLLKGAVLQNVEFCCRAIVNKFNKHNLPKLYTLPVAESLPRIEKMKIVSSSEKFQTIERAVRFEIQTKGHCTQLKDHPKVLNVLCVKSILKYYDKKNQIGKIG